jgi:L-fuconolactonase
MTSAFDDSFGQHRDEEPVLEPALEIIDSHHHLWTNRNPPYMLDELRSDAAGRRIKSTVYVECRSAYRSQGPETLRSVGETEWVHSLGIGDGFADAIVGFADLTLGDAVVEVLDAHMTAGCGKFRGIRHITAWDATVKGFVRTSPGLMGRSSFGSGLSALAQADLSFDAWVYSPQIPELTARARELPDLTIILNHIGGPFGIGRYYPRREEHIVRWRESMRVLSQCPNVMVKLGGIGMPIFGVDYPTNPATSSEIAEFWGPYIRLVIDMFGPDRCMFESNFPVDRQSFGYQTCWNAFVRMTDGFGSRERHDLFRGTAARVYKL